MTVILAYCDVPGCEDPKDPGFPRPAFRNGKCSSHMKQLQRTGRTAPIKEKLPVSERLIEAYGRFAEADSDEDYERHKREFRVLAKALGKEEISSSLKEALARARAAGRRLGRPPKVDRARVIDLVRLLGRTSLVARVLQVSTRTIQRCLLQATKTRVLSQPVRPRRAG